MVVLVFSAVLILSVLGVTGRSPKYHPEKDIFFKDPTCPKTSLKSGEFPIPDIPQDFEVFV